MFEGFSTLSIKMYRQIINHKIILFNMSVLFDNIILISKYVCYFTVSHNNDLIIQSLFE